MVEQNELPYIWQQSDTTLWCPQTGCLKTSTKYWDSQHKVVNTQTSMRTCWENMV